MIQDRTPSATGLRAGTEARVLAEIRRLGMTARVDLAQTLDLSPATISAVIGDLLDAGLVCQTRAPTAQGRGRPRVHLSLNADARYVAGAKLDADAVTVAVLNFKGEILADAAVPFAGAGIDAEALLASVVTALDAVLARAGLGMGQIAAFGLGVPGFIDVATGYCHWSPLLTGGPIDLGGLFGARLACPVFVDNDANLVTLAELMFGYGRDARDFLVVTVEQGVGLGVVIDGRLFRGARGLGAEFGHTKVQIDGALCRCGQRGCLEAYVADYALAREVNVALGAGQGIEPVADALDRLARQANAGHEVSAMIYRRAGRMLGLGLANLANLFDPALIVLAGTRIQNHHLLAEEVERTLQRNTIAVDRPPVRLAVHRWGDNLWARGAGALALDGLSSSALIATP